MSEAIVIYEHDGRRVVITPDADETPPWWVRVEHLGENGIWEEKYLDAEETGLIDTALIHAGLRLAELGELGGLPLRGPEEEEEDAVHES